MSLRLLIFLALASIRGSSIRTRRRSKALPLRSRRNAFDSSRVSPNPRPIPSPSSTSGACWVSYRALVKELVPNFDIESSCGYHPEWVSRACKNVTTGSQFERLIPESKLKDLRENCNQQLQNSSQCALCANYLLKVQAHLEGLKKDENVSDCSGYPYIYAAALINRLGPTDKGTKSCLFSFHLSHSSAPPRRPWQVVAISGAMMGSLIGIFRAALAVACTSRGDCMRERREKKNSYVAELESISASAYLVMGKLQDGSEAAVKRFKNCSVGGNRSFVHEVEVIASVKHINLMNLRGYCTAAEPLQGHQRMILRVVLLELVSGKKAVLSADEGKTCLLTDWAWSLVRQGRALDVVEENMPEMGSQEAMEQYVFIAVLRCHPNFHARPTMDQIVKLLETNGHVSLFSGPPVYTPTTDCL
ncbi:receptor-like kinase in in flowers 3 [Actinidia rufa]|uniref:Receptor-like kinase in in flowers 3 n=1 Tax=Actinidia rufa TaxID=165716 RepID=A0A7J0EZX0_9ERIC|nr:receptor-like kinase in in flowers 3 [Actinidia rufa]